jgi:hypothetical protein
MENFINLKKLVMPVFKYVVLFGWSLVLLSIVIFIIRSHPFIRKKRGADLNISESIYAVAMLVSASLVLAPLLQVIASDFDIALKFYPEKWMATLVTSGSLMSIFGVGIFILLFVTTRGLSTLFFFKRDPLIEFDANHIAYALLRAGLLLSLSLLLSPFCGQLYQYLLPAISTPFYH